MSRSQTVRQPQSDSLRTDHFTIEPRSRRRYGVHDCGFDRALASITAWGHGLSRAEHSTVADSS